MLIFLYWLGAEIKKKLIMHVKFLLNCHKIYVIIISTTYKILNFTDNTFINIDSFEGYFLGNKSKV